MSEIYKAIYKCRNCGGKFYSNQIQEIKDKNKAIKSIYYTIFPDTPKPLGFPEIPTSFVHDCIDKNFEAQRYKTFFACGIADFISFDRIKEN